MSWPAGCVSSETVESVRLGGVRGAHIVEALSCLISGN